MLLIRDWKYLSARYKGHELGMVGYFCGALAANFLKLDGILGWSNKAIIIFSGIEVYPISYICA